jgi:hypothetical protein
MTTYDDRFSIVAFLAACSRNSLDDFLLAKHSRASTIEKDLRELIWRLGENIAYVELANLLREFERLKQGRGATELATSPQRMILPPNGWHWILDRNDLSHIELSTLLGIKSLSNSNHVAQCASIQIARRVKLSIQSIERGLCTLRKKKFIETKSFGKGLLIQVLEPPPLLFAAPSHRGTSSLPQRVLVPPTEGSGPSHRGTLSVKQYPGTPASSEAGLPVRDPALTPAARATDPELRKLELQAEILGRTERLQKASSLGTAPAAVRVGEGPKTTGAVKREVIERDRRRQEEIRKAARK